MMSGMSIVKCQHCGAEVYVGPAREPVHFVTREADDFDPPTFLIIGGDWLLHRCVLDDARSAGRKTRTSRHRAHRLVGARARARATAG